MQFCITPNNVDNAIKLINKNVFAIVLSIKGFANRSNYYFNLDEIEFLIKNKKQTKIFINLNCFIFENQIEELTNILIKLQKLNIDKLLFNDFSIPQICYEQNLKINLHYHSTTLFTSFGQYDFFKNNNINSFSISNELFLKEVEEIAQQKPNDCELLLQIHGFVLIMHSRWNLISNFKKYVNDTENEYTPYKKIFIKELNKVYPNLIYENEFGTFMFTGYELCLLSQLKTLIDLKINYFLIDTFLIDDNEYDLKLFDLYNKFKKNNVDVEKLLDEFKQITKNKLSPGFLGSIDDILHLKKIN